MDGFYIHDPKEINLQCPPGHEHQNGQRPICVVPGQVMEDSVGFVTSGASRSVSLVWTGVEASLSPGYSVTYTVLIKMSGRESMRRGQWLQLVAKIWWASQQMSTE